MTRKRLLIDANLLVLLVAGTLDAVYLRKHKNLAQFDDLDFQILMNTVAESDGLILCPHVLTETSSLLRQIGDPAQSLLSAALGAFLIHHPEVFAESRAAVRNRAYVRLGLTDAVLLEMAEPGRLLLTTDGRLYDAVVRAGHEAINFNHLRDLRPDFN